MWIMGACEGYWTNNHCEGTPECPPRCPRFTDKRGTPLLALPFEDGDRAALLDMYDQFSQYDRAQGLPPQTRERTAQWLDRLDARGLNIVVHGDGSIVGHVGIVPMSSETPELVVFVHPDWQGRGIGTELMKQAIAHVSAAGRESLRLEVMNDNRTALAVYENIGFDVIERTFNELEMQLPLSLPIAEEVQLPPASR